MKTLDVMAECGWMIGAKDVESVPLVELLTMREKWPLSYQKATTNRERLMSFVLDTGINSSLLAVKFYPHKNEKGKTLITVAWIKEFADQYALAKQRAAECYEIAQALDSDNEWEERLRGFDWLSAEIDAAGATDTDIDNNNWYQWLDYPTLEDWHARPPWWEREEYSSEDEALDDLAEQGWLTYCDVAEDEQ